MFTNLLQPRRKKKNKQRIAALKLENQRIVNKIYLLVTQYCDDESFDFSYFEKEDAVLLYGKFLEKFIDYEKYEEVQKYISVYHDNCIRICNLYQDLVWCSTRNQKVFSEISEEKKAILKQIDRIVAYLADFEVQPGTGILLYESVNTSERKDIEKRVQLYRQYDDIKDLDNIEDLDKALSSLIDSHLEEVEKITKAKGKIDSNDAEDADPFLF